MNNQDLLFDLLKSIQNCQLEHSEILTKVQVDLEYHIKRTDLLEQQVELQKQDLNKRLEIIEEPFKIASGTGKLLLKLTTLFAALFGIWSGIKTFFYH